MIIFFTLLLCLVGFCAFLYVYAVAIIVKAIITIMMGEKYMDRYLFKEWRKTKKYTDFAKRVEKILE